MLPATENTSPPAHGFRGDPEPVVVAHPRGLSLAISREAGARGGSIARKVGELLGWQVFDQETIDYLIQNDDACEQLFFDLPSSATSWASLQFARLQREHKHLTDPET